MQTRGVTMPIALPSLENETVMPNRENLVKVGKSVVKVVKVLLNSVKVVKVEAFFYKKLPCFVS